MIRPFALATAFAAASGAAQAGPCDYKPSQLAVMAADSLTGETATGAARQAGHYALLHPGTTASAASTAAGTVAGATAQIGGIGAILMAPVTLTVGSVAAAGGALFEGACYFQVQRITDPEHVRQVLADVAANDPRATLVPAAEGESLELNIGGEVQSYDVARLYIADGRLKHRDRLRNTDLGPIVLVAPEAAG
ncbi:hypothetical protein [Palleronia sp.]|uniref:hypothetical protein n=1 Tax=Palleronia sp. TaxID=1940284 RepID=UPI0035C801F1